MAPDCTLQGVTDDSLPELRASDADREQTAEILRRAAGEGRLTMDELEERLHLTYESRTHAELERLTADVVAPQAARAPARHSGEGGAGWLVSVMGGRERRGRWRVGRHLKVVDVMGGSNVDLNDAELPPGDLQITVVAIMGGSEIRVPEGLNVEVSEFAVMGGNDVRLGEETPEPGGPTLRIRMVSIMGGSSVKRGRRRSKAERRALRHERRALKHAGHEQRGDRPDR
jgi:Domain of unknown function (DUF1707)/Cell wall-active antibiotics response 4TMS YvqF